MNFQQSIFQNNNLKIIKYLSLIVLIFALSFKANTEIPEKYKIESSLSKCKGTDYTKWTDCYGKYKFPYIEYKGEWKDGEFHGQGIYTWPDKAKYIGTFKEGLRNGKGFFEIPNGIKFEGEFEDDQYLKGIFTFPNGNEYSGDFKDGQFHGQGIFTSINGEKYIGQFIEGKRAGN